MDNLLVLYLSAQDERARQEHLDELLTLRAAPLIRGVLLRRLGFYVSAQGLNKNNQDAEDLYQEAMTRVVEGLDQLQRSTSTNIESFELYVSRLAANLCIDFLRTQSPARTRLKYRLRDLLKLHKDLAIWQHDGEMLCGAALWRDIGKRPFSDQPFQDLETEMNYFKSLYFADEDVRRTPVSQVVTDLFDWIGGPIEIDAFVRILAYLLEIEDQQIDSLDDPGPERWDGFGTQTPSGESNLEANELLTRLWQAITHLPGEQRDTFAFGFQDQAGQDLFTVLIAAGIANWDELADGMSRSVEEIARLRVRMPMDSATLADELRASRNNVYKWRFRAIQQLKAKLAR